MFAASPSDSWSVLADYTLRVSPGVAMFVVCLALVPRMHLGARIVAYIGLFVLIRDAMTPAGLWSIDGLRMHMFDDGAVLAVLGVTSVVGVVALRSAEKPMAHLLVWRSGRLTEGAAVGVGAGLAIGVGALAASGFSPSIRDQTLSFALGMAVLAYGGNLLEEVLFRGYLQGWMATRTSPVRAALVSGVSFAACHSFLAITVTDAGMPILAFTATEGLACAFVRMCYGIWAACLTHGTAIWLVATPLA